MAHILTAFEDEELDVRPSAKLLMEWLKLADFAGKNCPACAKDGITEPPYPEMCS